MVPRRFDATHLTIWHEPCFPYPRINGVPFQGEMPTMVTSTRPKESSNTANIFQQFAPKTLMVVISAVAAFAIGCTQSTPRNQASKPSETGSHCQGGACPLCPGNNGSAGGGEVCSLSDFEEPECEIMAFHYVPDPNDPENGTLYAVTADETIALRLPGSPDIPEDDSSGDSCSLGAGGSGGSDEGCCSCDLSNTGADDAISSRHISVPSRSPLMVGKPRRPSSLLPRC